MSRNAQSARFIAVETCRQAFGNEECISKNLFATNVFQRVGTVFNQHDRRVGTAVNMRVSKIHRRSDKVD